MNQFDVIVVGAGPGGSCAALGLARGGARVLLLDKFDFPRDKPCGDFIGRQAYTLSQRLGVAPARFAAYPPLEGVQMRTPNDKYIYLAGKRAGAASRIIPRRVFDKALVKLAVEAGATFARSQVSDLLWDNGRVAGIKGPTGEIKAPLVIGADGWSSVVARGMGLTLNEKATTGIAIRAYFEGVKGLNNMVAFHFPETILPGYGWLFPVGSDGGANVGLGLIAEEYGKQANGSLNRLFERFLAQTEALAGARQVGKSRSWPLALGWQSQRPLAAPGAMLVGDAACLVGPLTGAGIYPAMRSGLLAAETALRALAQGDYTLNTLSQYEKRVRREFRWRLKAEEAAQRWLRDPRHMNGLLNKLPHIPFSNVAATNLLFNLG